MSINAIDGVARRRPVSYDNWPGLGQDTGAAAALPAVGSAMQMLSALLPLVLQAAAQQLGNGAGGGAGPGGHGGGAAGGPGGLGGPAGTQGAGGLGGQDPMQGLLGSVTSLLQALAPLLQALQNRAGMKPGEQADRLSGPLGGDAAPPPFGKDAGSTPPHTSGGTPQHGGGSATPPASGATPGQRPGADAPGHAGHAGGAGNTGNTGNTAPAGTAGSVKPQAIPPATGTVTVNEPIVVKAGTTFNGGGELYQAGPALGDGGQSETQKPVFVLEPGAKLENVQVAGADGVHTRGDATLEKVWWKDVGEDAMTMKGPGNVKVIGGGAYNASDKIFQINAPGSLSIDGFTADTFGKAVRTNGGKEFPISIDIRNSEFRNGDEAVVRTDAKQAKVHLGDDVVVQNVPNDVLAPPEAEVVGAKSRGSKSYSG